MLACNTQISRGGGEQGKKGGREGGKMGGSFLLQELSQEHLESPQRLPVLPAGSSFLWLDLDGQMVFEVDRGNKEL